jgi:hypothetical protein
MAKCSHPSTFDPFLLLKSPCYSDLQHNTMFRGSVKSTGYPLHSPISPSIPLPCVTVCYHISIGRYHRRDNQSDQHLDVQSGCMQQLCFALCFGGAVLWLRPDADYIQWELWIFLSSSRQMKQRLKLRLTPSCHASCNSLFATHFKVLDLRSNGMLHIVNW